MKKTLVYIIALKVIVVLFSSCNFNHKKEISGYAIEQDSGVSVSIVQDKLPERSPNAHVYFVKYFDTPVYDADYHLLLHNTCAGAYWGIEKGDYIYCTEHYDVTYTVSKNGKVLSSFKQTMGNNFVFPKETLTREPRETFYWLLQMKDYKGLNSFLKNICFDDNSNNFKEYRDSLKKQILSKKGISRKRKMINYTNEVLGDYEKLFKMDINNYSYSYKTFIQLLTRKRIWV
jgi:hypothetical protein